MIWIKLDNNKINKYNEFEYAKYILEYGLQTKYITYELKLLAKYYSSYGLGEKETAENLEIFCAIHRQDYSKVRDYKLIENAMKNGYGKQFIVVTGINIMKQELELIENLKLDDVKNKILLSLLFKIKLNYEISKINNENIQCDYYFASNLGKAYTELKKISNIPVRQNIHEHIYEMIQCDILSPRYAGSVYMDCMKVLQDDNDDIFYRVELQNFEKIGHVWDLFVEKNNVKECAVCNTLVKMNNNRQKYCKDCAKYINVKQTIDRKSRNNLK